MTLDRARIGRYDILTRLSVGGMAEVFLAVAAGPAGFRKFVVLKHILPQYEDDHDFVGMFLDEARITAALSHSNIAQVFDLGQEAGELFLVMEFLAGQDLSSVRKAAARHKILVPVGLSCRVVRDVCLALHYAHHFVDPSGLPLPVIHRDVSPRNIMVTYAGSVKVIDFGIAKARGLLERTQQGLMKGSLGYMSPEQTLASDLDGRSDLFSAGVILHELLVGGKLFRVAGDPRKTTDRLFGEQVAPAHTINSRVPPELSRVVLRALERDRDRRYATGKEMARAIEDAIGTELFDDEKLAAFLRELFAEKIEDARRLLSVGPGGDVREAAGALAHGPESGPRHSPDSVTRQHTPTPGESASWKTPSASAVSALKEPAVILAVDDSKVGRKLVELHLGKAGFHVVTTSSPAEALEMLVEMRPHLILLDVVMPGMNGFELCGRIREQHGATTPIIFVSSACSLEERTRGLQAGADDFVRKPYDPADLVARVRGHLRGEGRGWGPHEGGQIAP